MGDSEPHHAPVGEVDRTLYKPLAKSTPANYKRTVLILQGSCNNLGSRSGELVHQNGNLSIL